MVGSTRASHRAGRVKNRASAWRASVLAAACTALGGCAAACPAGLSAQQGVTLYFGGSLDSPAWQAFAADTLTPAFPDGFTVFDAAGQWRDPVSRTVVRERTRVVQVFGPDVLGRAAAVAGAYRSRFHQVSVGMVSGRACAAF